MQNYNTTNAASYNQYRVEAEMLKMAEAEMVINSVGMAKEQPLNKTDTILFTRVNPYNMGSNGVAQIDPASFETAEGTTPNASTISYTDVTTQLKQFSVLFKLSSKTSLMNERDIPADMKRLTAVTLAEVNELLAYGEYKGGSNVIYANGSTRAGVNTAISLNKLRLAARTLEDNMGRKVTEVIKPGPNYDTKAVEPAFVVYMHTNCCADVRNLVGFTPRAEYGTAMKPIHEREFGACEEFRFVTSPLFRPFTAAGSSTLNGMLGSGNVDVYPMIVTAQDAWGHVSLKGHGKIGISPTYIDPSVKNHANPSGMFGYVGADFWAANVRLNENWMVRIECGATSL